MSQALRLTKEAAPPAPSPMYRFSVAQYRRMVETGILTESDRVELIEGWILAKKPHTPLHDATACRINHRLVNVLPDGWLWRRGSAVTLRDSEPEPDVTIVREPITLYETRHPVPRDVALLIEVADVTLPFDRETKGRLYAAARIPEYWIVNLVDTRVEIYTQPRAGKAPAYRQRRDFGRDDALPLTLGGREYFRIPTRQLLPGQDSP